MYLVFLHACQVRVTFGDSGLCCCICVMYFACTESTQYICRKHWEMFVTDSFHLIAFDFDCVVSRHYSEPNSYFICSVFCLELV